MKAQTKASTEKVKKAVALRDQQDAIQRAKNLKAGKTFKNGE
jgi:hypothetical protein